MKSNRSRSRSAESGYVLLAVMLTVTLILVALAVEAPRIAQQIKREKEEELVHRGKDYATAVKRFVHKNGGRYPVSVEQLENTNHIRFLRKKYVDPMTGESEWKIVHVGEAEIKIPAPNPGLSGGGGQNPGLFGSGGQGAGAGQGSGAGQGAGAGGQNNPALPNTLVANPVGNGQTVGGGQIMGVASVNKGQAIKEFNDKDHYNEWYFVYDLRLEQSGGTGVTVAAPRGTGNASGSGAASGSGNASGAGNASGSGNAPGAGGTTGSGNAPGSTGSPDSGTSSNPPNPGPTPPGQPTPTPPPQVPN